MNEQNPYRPSRMNDPNELRDLQRQLRIGIASRLFASWQMRLLVSVVFLKFGFLLSVFTAGREAPLFVPLYLAGVMCLLWTLFWFVPE